MWNVRQMLNAAASEKMILPKAMESEFNLWEKAPAERFLAGSIAGT